MPECWWSPDSSVRPKRSPVVGPGWVPGWRRRKGCRSRWPDGGVRPPRGIFAWRWRGWPWRIRRRSRKRPCYHQRLLLLRWSRGRRSSQKTLTKMRTKTWTSGPGSENGVEGWVSSDLENHGEKSKTNLFWAIAYWGIWQYFYHAWKPICRKSDTHKKNA